MTHGNHCWHRGDYPTKGGLTYLGCCRCRALLIEPSDVPREEKTHGMLSQRGVVNAARMATMDDHISEILE